jgi:hypothetical protein
MIGVQFSAGVMMGFLLFATQLPMHKVPGVFTSGVKRPRREADHPPQSSAGIKNAWSYTSTPPYVIMEWCLVRHRDKFYILPFLIFFPFIIFFLLNLSSSSFFFFFFFFFFHVPIHSFVPSGPKISNRPKEIVCQALAYG